MNGLIRFKVLSMFGSMPGRSHAGPIPPPSPDTLQLASELERDVTVLATRIGERHTRRPDGLLNAADWIAQQMDLPHWPVLRRHPVPSPSGVTSPNVEIERPGTGPEAREILVLGAHYDTVPGSPGANDNASGVAALLALARRAQDWPSNRTVRIVAFANEEPPHFQTEYMGSFQYARACAERGETIVAMISLETVAHYSDAPGSQDYPLPLGLFYPNRGNFIGFVGNRKSRPLLYRAIRLFRDSAAFPSEGYAGPDALPGVGWSDHWSFWQFDVPAFMLTDTAPYRYPHYHQSTDTPDRLDFVRTAQMLAGFTAIPPALIASPT